MQTRVSVCFLAVRHIRPYFLYIVIMCSLESFKIDLKSLKEGDTVISYSLDDAYFKAIDGLK